MKVGSQGPRNKLLSGAASLVLVAAAGQAGAQVVETKSGPDAPPAAYNEQPQTTVADVVVTGSHIRGAVSTGPVQEITHDDIVNGGFTSLSQIISSLPINFGGGPNVETRMGATVGATNGATLNVNIGNASTANLRGLGATSTLVLLNGVRLPPTADGVGVDLSLIPFSAIDRVEILADGASAVYGSDAVAGVINIITKQNYDGLQTQARYGAAANGQPDYQVSQTVGTNWASGNFVANYQHDTQGNLDAKYRSATNLEAVPNYIVPNQETNSAYFSLSQNVFNWTGYAEGFYSFRNSSQDESVTPTGVSYSLANRIDLKNNGGAIIFGFKNEPDSRVHLDVFGTLGHTYTDESEFESPAAMELGEPGLIEQTANDDTAAGEIRATGDLLNLAAGPIKAAGGVGYRSETATDENIDGNFNFRRSVYSAYGELQIPIVGGDLQVPLLKRVTLSVAGRYDHYSDFGSTANPRVGIDVLTAEDFSFKASYSTSFRAPSSYEESLLGAENLLNTASDPKSPTGTSVMLYRAGNNPELKPETARNISLTAVYQPHWVNGLRLSVDYFDINFRNRIEAPDPGSAGLFDLADPNIQGQILRAPTQSQVQAALASGTYFNETGDPAYNQNALNPAQVQAIVDARFQNFARSDTSGLDVNGSWDFGTSFGAWQASGAATYILNLTQQLTPNAPSTNLLNTIYEPVGFRGRVGLSWHYEGWAAASFVNYVDSYVDNRVPTSPVKIGSWTTADFHLGYSFADGIGFHALRTTSLAFNVTNLFNTEPPHVTPNLYGFAYDSTNSSAIGRVISIELTKAW